MRVLREIPARACGLVIDISAQHAVQDAPRKSQFGQAWSGILDNHERVGWGE